MIIALDNSWCPWSLFLFQMINYLWSSPRICCFRDLPSIPFCPKWEVFYICLVKFIFLFVSVKHFYEMGNTLRGAVSQFDDFSLVRHYLLILSHPTLYYVYPTESWIMISITIITSHHIMVGTMINTSFCTFGTWLPLKCTKSLIYFPKCTDAPCDTSVKDICNTEY